MITINRRSFCKPDDKVATVLNTTVAVNSGRELRKRSVTAINTEDREEPISLLVIEGAEGEPNVMTTVRLTNGQALELAAWLEANAKL